MMQVGPNVRRPPCLTHSSGGSTESVDPMMRLDHPRANAFWIAPTLASRSQGRGRAGSRIELSMSTKSKNTRNIWTIHHPDTRAEQ